MSAGWSATSHTDVFDARGREQRGFIKSLLLVDWDFAGKRVLDFGCGSGRILRPASQADPAAEFWGCDTDEPSIAWLRENLSPPLNVVPNGERPPLPSRTATSTSSGPSRSSPT